MLGAGITPRFVNCQFGASKVNYKVTLRKNTYIKYFHLLYLLLKKSFQNVVVKIDSLGAVSVPLPKIVMQLLNFTILRHFVVKLLLEGIFLAVARFRGLLLLSVRCLILTSLVVKFY